MGFNRRKTPAKREAKAEAELVGQRETDAQVLEVTESPQDHSRRRNCCSWFEGPCGLVLLPHFLGSSVIRPPNSACLSSRTLPPRAAICSGDLRAYIRYVRLEAAFGGKADIA